MLRFLCIISLFIASVSARFEKPKTPPCFSPFSDSVRRVLPLHLICDGASSRKVDLQCGHTSKYHCPNTHIGGGSIRGGHTPNRGVHGGNTPNRGVHGGNTPNRGVHGGNTPNRGVHGGNTPNRGVHGGNTPNRGVHGGSHGSGQVSFLPNTPGPGSHPKPFDPKPIIPHPKPFDPKPIIPHPKPFDPKPIIPHPKPFDPHPKPVNPYPQPFPHPQPKPVPKIGGVTLSGTPGMVQQEMAKAGFSTKAQANVLANLKGESGFIPSTEKVERFTAQNLVHLWPKRFPSVSQAQTLINKGPQAVAESIYGGRMGNNQPGDGWTYRGRGLIQLTGKENYIKVGKEIGVDLVRYPDLANDPVIAAKIVPAYFKVMAGRHFDPTTLEHIDKVTAIVGPADAKSIEDRKKFAIEFETLLRH